MLASLVWLAFGAIAIPIMLDRIDVATILYAVLSLTVVRMLPVALASIGAGLGRKTILFVGWFGPRGQASLVFALSPSKRSAPTPTRPSPFSRPPSCSASSPTGSPPRHSPAAYGRGAAARGPERGGPVPDLPVRGLPRARATGVATRVEHEDRLTVDRAHEP